MLQPEERAAAVGRGAAAALAAMAPLQPDSEERALALQGLQWTAQRLKLLGRRLGAAARVRELYRAAFVATASPKAVSDRLLKAAALLESEAQALDEHRAEWHALWRRERQGPMDPATEAGMRAHVEALRARAERMRALRDRYIQTGSLPAAAEEGLALVKLHRFDLVLMDIQLPGMNGIEALACLRADEGTRDIPVVAVTASVTMQDQSQITRAGFDAFISKPISVKEFVETVNSFVGKPA